MLPFRASVGYPGKPGSNSQPGSRAPGRNRPLCRRLPKIPHLPPIEKFHPTRVGFSTPVPTRNDGDGKLTSPPDRPRRAATNSTTAPACSWSRRRPRRAPASASAVPRAPACRCGATAPPRTGCWRLRRQRDDLVAGIDLLVGRRRIGCAERTELVARSGEGRCRPQRSGEQGKCQGRAAHQVPLIGGRIGGKRLLRPGGSRVDVRCWRA